MLEPSKPIPSLNRSSSRSSMGIEKCCQMPGRSMNRRSTICTPLSLASFRTSFGVVGIAIPFFGNGEVCRAAKNLPHGYSRRRASKEKWEEETPTEPKLLSGAHGESKQASQKRVEFTATL